MPKQKDTYYILMGDVIGSSDYDLNELGASLKKLVNSANEELKSKTPSPFTVTLGDEFQGVTKNLKSGIESLLYFEELRYIEKFDFKLHYVLHFGTIKTEINPDSSYGMLGEGLTQARKILTAKKRDRKRFNFSLDKKELSDQLNRIFEVVDGITSRWKEDDFELILEMIQNENDQAVGEKHEKHRSQIYRRRKTLMINEYNQLINFILNYINTSAP